MWSGRIQARGWLHIPSETVEGRPSEAKARDLAGLFGTTEQVAEKLLNSVVWVEMSLAGAKVSA